MTDISGLILGGIGSIAGVVALIYAHIANPVRFDSQSFRSSPLLTQDQRLQWIRELLTSGAASLHYRVAGIPVLLYAQPSTLGGSASPII